MKTLTCLLHEIINKFIKAYELKDGKYSLIIKFEIKDNNIYLNIPEINKDS